MDFGEQPSGGRSASQLVAISNISPRSVDLAGPDLAGADAAEFQLIRDTCTGEPLLPEHTCSYEVVFTPTLNASVAPQPRIAELRLQVGEPGALSQVVVLRGVAVPRGDTLWTPTSLVFPDQRLGTRSVQQVAILTSETPQPLVVTGVSLAGDSRDFVIGRDTCAGSTLAGSADCEVEISFVPRVLGDRNANVTVTDAASNSHVLHVHGVGIGPVVRAEPSVLDFGPLRVGSVSQDWQEITLRNTGTVLLRISEVRSSNDFIVNPTCSSVDAGKACSILVKFSPQRLGTIETEIAVVDDASGSPHTITVRGIGTAPLLSVATATFDFGDEALNRTGGAQPLTLRNVGTAPLVVTAVRLDGTNRTDFDLDDAGCTGRPLNPDESCTMKLRFRPIETGSRTATVVISDNTEQGTHSVSLRGTGRPS